MPKKKRKGTCTGCGKALGIVKVEFDSIPGGVFCPGCAQRIEKQMNDKKDGK